MSQAVSRFLFITVFAGIVLSLLAGIVSSWTRWARVKQSPTVFSTLSLIGLTLATACAALAFLPSLRPRSFGVAQALAPRFSLAGFLFALGGSLRPNPLRWHALACAAGMFLFWFLSLVSG
jgi:hypothetical protein